MEHKETKQYLQNLIARQPEAISETKSVTKPLLNVKPLSESRVIKIFSRFRARYPHKWQSTVDDDEIYLLTIADWRDELAGLTDDQIIVGLKNLPKSWPPTSGEFRSLCEPVEKVKYLGYANRIAFEKPRDKKAGQAAMANIKKLMGK